VTAHDEWVQRDAQVVWHGFTQMATFADNRPIIVDRAEGHELIDVDGTRYLDAISSLWVTTLGHHVPELDDAIIRQLALGAQKLLGEQGVPVRVVSMPSTTVFDRQTDEYRKSVLPDGMPRVAVEAGVTDFWRKYVGLDGAVVGLDRFGESAPAGDLFKHFGFSAENVAKAVRSTLGE